jgi:hypothetical protein
VDHVPVRFTPSCEPTHHYSGADSFDREAGYQAFDGHNAAPWPANSLNSIRQVRTQLIMPIGTLRNLARPSRTLVPAPTIAMHLAGPWFPALRVLS